MLQRPTFVNARVRTPQPFLRPITHLSSTATGPFTDTLVTRPGALLAHETEDSMLTGGTRSLNRRLLALNMELTISRHPARPQPATQSMDPLGLSA